MKRHPTKPSTAWMRAIWQGILVSALLGLAGGPVIANQPSAPPPLPSASCPPVVQGFLETVGLLPALPDYALPLVVIDTQGHPLECLPRTLSAQEHAQAAVLLHQSGIIMARNQEAKHVCRFGETSLERMSFIGLIVSYDLAQMKSPACLQQARQDLDVLKDRQSGKAPLTQP